MRLFKLERSQILPISIEQAWAYFSNPLNLAEITPPSLSFKIKGRFDGTTTNGMLIEYSVRPIFGVEMDWVSEIKHVQAPYYFVDEQRVGPYKLWYHQHIFRPLGKDQVNIVDLVHYALPLGPLAGFLNDCIVKDRLIGIFNYRKYVLEQKFQRKLDRYEQESKV